MTVATDQGGVLIREGDDGAWLEEVVVDPPTHILNGFLWAIWGVRDYAVAVAHARGVGLCCARVAARCAAISRRSTAASGRSTNSRVRGCRCWQAHSTMGCT